MNSAIFRRFLNQIGVPMFARDGSNNVIGLLDRNTPVAVLNETFTTVAALLAETPAEGTCAYLSSAAFTGTGKRTKPLLMVYVSGVWRPFEDYALLFKAQFGTQAVPTMNRTTTGVYAFATTILIPGGLVKDGDSLWTVTRTQKHGAAGTAAVRCRLGTNVDDTLNSLLFQISPAATDLGGQTLISEATRTTSTSLFSTSNGTLNANHASGFFADKATNIDFSVDQYLVYSLTTITAPDTVDLLSIEVGLKSGVLV